MKTKWLAWCVLLCFPLWAWAGRAPQNDDFFVKMWCDKEKVVEGDSCLLSVVAYAVTPFQLQELPKNLKVNNGSLRQLRIGQQSLQQVVENRKVYFALVVEQYVLRPKKVGMVTVPSQKYGAVLHVEEGAADPFDAFFGRPRRVRKIKCEGRSVPFELKVVEKPKRTTLEMKESGIQVL